MDETELEGITEMAPKILKDFNLASSRFSIAIPMHHFFYYFCGAMHAFVSISLVVLFLFKGLVPGMDFSCELQKLPNLFEHYEAHKQCHEDSFWTFLIDHYLNSETDDHHPEAEHENLPLHGSHHCSYVAVFYPEEQHFSLTTFGFKVQPKFGYHHFSFHSQFLDSLFQPPRV